MNTISDMKERMPIGDVRKAYGVTSRTLRYYEEVGLICSHRHDNGYRGYDGEAVTRLEQILFLRELKLSIKEIGDVLDTQDTDLVASILSKKLDSIRQEMASLESLKRALQICLGILDKKGTQTMPAKMLKQRIEAMVQCESVPKTEMEVKVLKSDTIEKLSRHEVRTVNIPPMTVASYRAVSAEPETDAWDALMKWKEEYSINKGQQRRQFGFDNPCPQGDNPIYGYEVWEEVDEGTEGNDGVVIKTFEGGIYAVATVTALDPYMDIPRRWRQLHQWVAESEHQADERQCLEEHLPAVEGFQEGFQLDLHYPIKLK